MSLRLLLLVIAIPLLYLLIALTFSLVPANARWEEARSGVTIFIRSNGVHTWIMVPKVTAEMDWRRIAPAEHIEDPRYAGNYVAIGFGNRDFYLNTPTWGDLSVRTAFAAIIGGGPSLMHVDHAWSPKEREDQRALTLRPDEFGRLTKYLVGSFDLEGGQSKPLIGRGYGPSDIFYEATRKYDFQRTCNEWTGEALRAAGVKTGIWTPFEPSIMLRFN